jgi:sugar/nucleoside kinase (ribokinase family)
VGFAVSLQGLLRSAAADGRVVPHPEPWRQVEPFLRPRGFAFLSNEDTPDAIGLGRMIAAAGATAVVTMGERGVTVCDSGGERHLPAFPVRVADPTGAGDCFAAAFFVRWLETQDLMAACAFGLAAGALAIQAPGLQGVPTRAAVEAMLTEVAA